jgi:hypothetical protein
MSQDYHLGPKQLSKWSNRELTQLLQDVIGAALNFEAYYNNGKWKTDQEIKKLGVNDISRDIINGLVRYENDKKKREHIINLRKLCDLESYNKDLCARTEAPNTVHNLRRSDNYQKIRSAKIYVDFLASMAGAICNNNFDDKKLKVSVPTRLDSPSEVLCAASRGCFFFGVLR